MKITISGKPGSGKSSVAKLIAKKLKLQHYSAGDLWRELAKNKKITILELNKLAEKDDKYDHQLDKNVEMLGKTKDNFVIDGRLTFNFIPDSIKIFLDADLNTRAKRIHKDARAEEDNKDINDTLNKLRARESSEKKRYKQLYGIDPYTADNFDFVIDTSSISVDEVVSQVVSFVKMKISQTL